MKIIKGKLPHAKKITIYGPEGIGKSTFASKFPEPIFIDTEGSTKEMDVSRFEKPTSWTMLLEQIKYVCDNPEICKTLVIDTVDWAEQMCVEYICAKHQKDGIESFGYGNGYVYTKEEFGRFLNRLEDVVERGVNVVLIAHAQMRKFEQPDEMGAYDRWELKLGKKTSSQTAPLIKEWNDALLFANYKTYSIAVDDKGKKHKAQGGKRVMYTSHHPCWDAKNRYGLDEEIPFDYTEIAHILGSSRTQNIQQAAENKAAEAQQTTAEATLPQKEEKTAHFMDIPDGIPEQMEFKPEPDTEPLSVNQKLSGQKEQAPQTDMSKSQVFRLNSYIPKALQDLMYPNLASEEELMEAVYRRGFFPRGTPFQNLPKEFVDGCLIAAWPKVLAVIKEIRSNYEIPFE